MPCHPDEYNRRNSRAQGAWNYPRRGRHQDAVACRSCLKNLDQYCDEPRHRCLCSGTVCSHINVNLYFNTAKGRESQITDLSKLHSHFGQEKCDALVGLHPFSGCDSQATLFKSGRCSERDLPPNQDSLHKHIQRASNLAAVHRRSLECYQDIPPPINHGWKMAVRWTGCHFHQLQRRSLSLFTAPAKKKNCQGKMYMQSVWAAMYQPVQVHKLW